MTDVRHESDTRDSNDPQRVDAIALGELSAVLAHEMRNPLSSIKGAAQILQQEYGGQKPQSEWVAIILDGVDKLAALSSEFMEFALPAYPELAWASWNDTVERAITAVQPAAAEADIIMEYDPAPGLPSVLIDRLQMERAIRNLVLNAVQASPRGSAIWVRTQRTTGGVSVAVQDSGTGVSPENLARIFVPFFKTKLAGTGLGLPVARRIARIHGGDVTALLNDGPGMTFILRLPASEESGV